VFAKDLERGVEMLGAGAGVVNTFAPTTMNSTTSTMTLGWMAGTQNESKETIKWRG